MLLLLRPVAQKVGLLDCPGGRKCHEGSVPLIGGIAIYIGFLLAAFLSVDLLPQYRGILAASVVILIVGALDDFNELTAKPRLIAQVIVALMLVYVGDRVLLDLGELVNEETVVLGMLAVPFTVVSVVGVINSLNMIDGIDGLAASVALVILLMFLSVVSLAGIVTDASLLLAVIGGLSAFLLFNLPVSWNRSFKIFLGDSGSMFLGLVLVWCCIKFTQGEHALISPVTALWFMAYPVMDTVAIMVRRMMKGRSPFSADRDHLHHVLLHAGLSVRKSLALIVLINLIFGAVGLLGHHFDVPHNIMFFAFLILFALYFYTMLHAWRFMKVVRKYLAPNAVLKQEIP